MADTKISALPAVAAVDAAQELPVSDAGTSKKVSLGAVAEFAGGRVLDEDELAANSATMTLTIPAGFKRLFLYVEIAGLTASGMPRLQFNNVTTTSQYGTQKLFIVATAVADAQVTGQPGIELYDAADTNGALIRAEIRNMAGEAKIAMIDGHKSDTASLGQQDRYIFGGIWNNTADEISEIDIVASAGLFEAGSRAWVVGY